MKNSVIYKIRNILNNKIYIGSAIDFNQRKKYHKYQLKNNKHHSIKLQRAWNKYGEGCFVFEIIETVDITDNLLTIEQKYLDLFKPWKTGYNVSKIAGSTLGVKHTQKTKDKMSKVKTGVKTGPRTIEAKKNMSKAQLNRDNKVFTEKRIRTMLEKDANIFKKIGNKSSITQKKNGLNSGKNNPNFNGDKVQIFNNSGELVYETTNDKFKQLCEENGLPIRCLIKSRLTNGGYKLFEKQKPKNISYIKYTGWYCKYKNTKI